MEIRSRLRYAWGDDRAGQLGRGSEEAAAAAKARSPRKAAIAKQRDDDFAAAPGVVAFFERRGAWVRTLACGLHHTLAVAWEPRGDDAVTARLYSWGFGDNGRLGTGATGAQSFPARVLLPLGDDPTSGHVTAVAAGDQHSLALLSDGTVFAWGDNSHGQLGLGKATGRPVEMPEEVRLRTHEGAATRVACGARHSGCVTSSGAVLLWGFSDEGQLGLGPEVAELESTQRDVTALPLEAPLMDDGRRGGRWNAEALGLGVRHTVVLSPRGYYADESRR